MLFGLLCDFVVQPAVVGQARKRPGSRLAHRLAAVARQLPGDAEAMPRRCPGQATPRRSPGQVMPR
eukprot:39704-Chlamydomonas_euryale.AAC.1